MENKPTHTDEKKPRRTKEKDVVKEVKEVKEKEKVEDKKPRRTKDVVKEDKEDKELKEKEKIEEKIEEKKPRPKKDKDVVKEEKEKEKIEEKKPRRTKDKDVLKEVKEKEKEKIEEKKPSRAKDKDVVKEKEKNDDEDVEYPFLDMPYLINNTRNYDSLKVCLKMTRKGVGLFSRLPIKKGNTVAYYKVKVISERSKYKKVKDGMYTFSIYTKDDEKIKKYFGDICMESLENPRRGAPFFGYLANEPSNGQTCNVFVDINLKDNYTDREEVRPGDFFLYKLVALRDIPENEEICWYYGDHYDRDYEISDRTR